MHHKFNVRATLAVFHWKDKSSTSLVINASFHSLRITVMRVQALSRGFILFVFSNVLKKMLPFWNFWIKVKEISVLLLKVLNPKLLHDTSMNAGFQCRGGYLDYPVCCSVQMGSKQKHKSTPHAHRPIKLYNMLLINPSMTLKKRTGFLF